MWKTNLVHEDHLGITVNIYLKEDFPVFWITKIIGATLLTSKIAFYSIFPYMLSSIKLCILYPNPIRRHCPPRLHCAPRFQVQLLHSKVKGAKLNLFPQVPSVMYILPKLLLFEILHYATL